MALGYIAFAGREVSTRSSLTLRRTAPLTAPYRWVWRPTRLTTTAEQFYVAFSQAVLAVQLLRRCLVDLPDTICKGSMVMKMFKYVTELLPIDPPSVDAVRIWPGLPRSSFRNETFSRHERNAGHSDINKNPYDVRRANLLGQDK